MTERRAILNRIATLEQEIRDCYAAADKWRLSAEAKEAALEADRTMLADTKRKQGKKLIAADPDAIDAFVKRCFQEDAPIHLSGPEDITVKIYPDGPTD